MLNNYVIMFSKLIEVEIFLTKIPNLEGLKLKINKFPN
jgi:hypothetical protein